MIPRRPPLPLRALAGVFNGLAWLTRGYALPFTAELLRSYGVRGVADRTAALERFSVLIEERLGERDGHMLLGFGALWNGCYVCALGHIYAGNLAHFRDRGELHPLDETELATLLRTGTDAELLAYAERCLAAPGDARLLGLVRRLYVIKRDGQDDGVDAEPGDTEMIAGAVAIYDFINLCTIYGEGETPPLIAFSRLNRDRRLRARYAAARQAARR